MKGNCWDGVAEIVHFGWPDYHHLYLTGGNGVIGAVASAVGRPSALDWPSDTLVYLTDVDLSHCLGYHLNLCLEYPGK